MKIRQYTATTMQEAILKIKVDLGPDAVILHTRKFKRGGFLGFFAQEMVEVLAAIDPQSEKSESKPAMSAAPRQAAYAAVEAGGKAAMPEALELGPLAAPWPPSSKPEALREESGPSAQQTLVAQQWMEAAGLHPAALAERQKETAKDGASEAATELAAETSRGSGSLGHAVRERGGESLAGEVQDLKSTVNDLKAMLGTIAGKLEAQPPRTPASSFPAHLQPLYERLVACEVSSSLARALLTQLQEQVPNERDFDVLLDALEAPVAGSFDVAGAVQVAPGEQKIVALVGPTGVGKTTTIAKLAANFALAREVDIALLTIDTYRVAAIEQLKIYGDIIGLPVEVVLTPQSLKDALKLHGEKDLILIDTAGRSPHNRMHLNELRSFLDFETQKEIHLVLSASTRLADLRQIVKNFSMTGIDRLIFTKTDETETIGAILSIAHESGLPVSYVTTGQSVPDDIQVADGPALARMLIQELKAFV